MNKTITVEEIEKGFRELLADDPENIKVIAKTVFDLIEATNEMKEDIKLVTGMYTKGAKDE